MEPVAEFVKITISDVKKQPVILRKCLEPIHNERAVDVATCAACQIVRAMSYTISGSQRAGQAGLEQLLNHPNNFSIAYIARSLPLRVNGKWIAYSKNQFCDDTVVLAHDSEMQCCVTSIICYVWGCTLAQECAYNISLFHK